MNNQTFEFKYDASLFIYAKNLIMNANIEGATAASLISEISNPEGESDLTCYTTGFSDEPTINFVDCSNISDIKNDVSEGAKKIAEFDEKMEVMVEALKKVDPELGSKIEKYLEDMEKQAIERYLDLGLSGYIYDSVTLTNLIKKYIDDDSLELTEDQKIIMEKYINIADYENLSGFEKAGQGTIALVSSFVEGELNIIEYICDGTVVILSEAISILFYPIIGKEGRENFLKFVGNNVVNPNSSADLYDVTIGNSGLNKYITYGLCHTVGVSAGEFTGEVLITMLPGGAAATAAVRALESTGKTAKDATKASDIDYAMASGIASGVTTLIGNDIASIEAKNNPILAAGIKNVTGYTQIAIRSTLDYEHQDEYDNYLDYIKNNDSYIKEGVGITIGNSFSAQYDLGKSDYETSNIFEAQQNFEENKDITELLDNSAAENYLEEIKPSPILNYGYQTVRQIEEK